MAEIKMPSGELVIVDDADVELVCQYAWSWATIRGGPKGYARAKFRDAEGRRKSISMHRLIMAAPPGSIVDHVSGDTRVNKRVNLRIATVSQNRANSKMVVGTSSGYKGVRKMPSGRWKAGITANHVWHYLGTFDTPIEAHAAYVTAAQQHFGEFANEG